MLNKLDLDLKNRSTLPAQPSIEELIVLELNAHISHLSYAFVEANNTLSVIIVSYFLDTRVKALLLISQMFNGPLVGLLRVLSRFHPNFTLIRFILSWSVCLELRINIV